MLFTPIVFHGGLIYGLSITFLVVDAVSISVVYAHYFGYLCREDLMLFLGTDLEDPHITSQHKTLALLIWVGTLSPLCNLIPYQFPPPSPIQVPSFYQLSLCWWLDR